MAFTERYVTDTGAGAHDGTSEANAWTFDEMVAAIGSNGSGIRVNVKSGNHTETLGFAVTVAGGSFFHIRGYHTTIGDLTPSRNANGTLNTTNFPVIDFQADCALGGGTILECLSIKSTTAGNTTFVSMTSAGCSLRGVYIEGKNNGASAIGVSSGSGNALFMCDVIMTGASQLVAVTSTTAGTVLYDCRITGKGGFGVRLTGTAAGGGLTAVNCVIYDSTYGATNETSSSGLGAPFNFFGCTFTGNTNDGIRMGSTPNTNGKSIVNSHITDNGGYAINNRSATSASLHMMGNRTRDNTSGATNLVGDQLLTQHVTTDNGGASTDYVDNANKDYRLVQGAAGRRASTLKNRDIGAHQSAPQIVGAVGG